MLGRAPERIETSRLLLRRPIRSDVAAVFDRYASDPDVTRYLSWRCHQSLSDTELFLDFSDSEWSRHRCGPYLAFALTSGTLLGGTGLAMRDAEAEAETGYVFARDAWGQGFATESLRAMLELARGLGLRRLRARCHPRHHASAHVLEKCGFTLERYDHHVQLYPNLGSDRQDVLGFVYSLSETPRVKS